MEKRKRFLSVLLAVTVLLAGCAGKSGSIRENLPAPTESAAPSGAQAQKPSGETALAAFRQNIAETSQIFAAAYLGNHYSEDPGIPVDPCAAMEELAPELYRAMPFLGEISQDRIIGQSGDLFCIVPLDPDATVAVSRGYWDNENEQYIYDDLCYSSMTGEPILVFCNDEGWSPDTQVYISGPSGEVFWCLDTDNNGYAIQAPFLDFSPYRELLKAEQQWFKTCGWVLPAQDQLIGTTWSWYTYLEDGTKYSCEMSIENDFLTALWNDGEAHVYHDAAWELTYEEDVAVLSIDFGEMAGVLRYNLLYQEEYGQLYVSLDVLQEDFPTGGEPLSRYMTKTSIPDPLAMVGTWELGWTEVDGDINGAEPGSHIIEITTDYEGHYQISYTNNEFPDRSFYHKDLAIIGDSLYYGCGNDRWYATVDHIGFGGTEYSLTMLPEDTLLLRQYWEQEGFRSVAHDWYTRTSGEDPYTYAISQGWRFPEFQELRNSFWLSHWCDYALELTEDSIPGDNGGWAAIYDVDEIGAYTQSYTGSWQYADGQLHLTLVPAGNGYLVDDSFLVLMLDGELWIGRNAYGTGLPHFYADTLDDVLEQPKG